MDDEESIRSFCTEVLTKESFDVVAASTPAEALEHAGKSRFDLFVLDVNLPGMTGFQLRDKIRALPQGAKTPIVFLTGADPDMEMEIARSLKGDKLMLKPISPPDLRRTVKVALRLVRAEAGPMPGSLERILMQVIRDKQDGVLTATAGQTVKRVVFREGSIAFAASNDPREVIGQAFVRSGLITEKDLAAALSARDASGGKPLGIVLTALRKVTKEQAEKVFSKKIRESVLELFLWKTGMVEFVASIEESDKAFPIALPTEPVLHEGKKRRVKWAEVERLIPDRQVTLTVKKWPAGFPKNDGDRVLAKHIETGRTMAEIMVELRGQDYAVGVRLAELVKAGALAASKATGFSGASPALESISIDLDDALSALDSDDTGAGATIEAPGASTITRILPGAAAPPVAPSTLDAGALEPLDEPPSAPPAAAAAAPPEPRKRADSIPPTGGQPDTVGMLTRALVMLRAGDLPSARAGLIEVLALDPLNPLARQRLAEIEATLGAQARSSSGLSPDMRVKLAVKLEDLIGKPIPPNDAFVLTRLAGTSLTVAELIQICPLPENEIWQVVQRHLAGGILAQT